MTSLIIAALLVTVVAAGFCVVLLRRNASLARVRDALEAELDTLERMQNADIVGDDPGAAKRWLRERGQ